MTRCMASGLHSRLSSPRLWFHLPVLSPSHHLTRSVKMRSGVLSWDHPQSRVPSIQCPSWLLKDVLPTVIPLMTDFINASLLSGVVPGTMKRAAITPLLKRPSLDADLLNNYRPVSNLPFVSKVLERVVASGLKAHMDINGLHDPFQSAYKAGHRTETALLKVQNNILRTVQTGGIVVLVLMGLSAAFDTIDHAILLERLRTLLGIDGMAQAWFHHTWLVTRRESESVRLGHWPSSCSSAFPKAQSLVHCSFWYTYSLCTASFITWTKHAWLRRQHSGLPINLRSHKFWLCETWVPWSWEMFAWYSLLDVSQCAQAQRREDRGAGSGYIEQAQVPRSGFTYCRRLPRQHHRQTSP